MRYLAKILSLNQYAAVEFCSWWVTAMEKAKEEEIPAARTHDVLLAAGVGMGIILGV